MMFFTGTYMFAEMPANSSTKRVERHCDSVAAP